MTKFLNKYRIESNRMPRWDYSGNGLYFITMITNHRICWFGKIKNKKMILSEYGKIAKSEWDKSFEIRNELFLDEFVLMPNHLHAIVILKKLNNHNVDEMNNTHGNDNQSNEQSDHGEQTKFFRKPKSVSSFVAGYKSATTNNIDDYIDLHNLNIKKFNHNNRLW